MLPSVEEIISIFYEGEQDLKLSFIDTWSHLHFKEQAKKAVEDQATPEMNYQSLDFLARGCLESGKFELAERIAESYYMLARSSFDLGLGDAFNLRYIAGLGALNWMFALQCQGDHKQIIDLIDEALEWLKASGDADHYERLRLKKVESLLELKDFNKAEKLFKEVKEFKLSSTAQASYRALEYRIRTLKGGKAQLPIDFSIPEGQKDLEVPSSLKEENVRQKIHQASFLLNDPVKGKDPAEIRKLEPELIAGGDWMRDHRFPRAENDACWSLYLAYNRTQREELALEQLQRIRSNIENARHKVSDPAERARLSDRFPYLYPCLCTLFHKLGRFEELLEAIEASKSRALADLITLKTGKPVTERELSMSVKELPSHLRKLKSHYYSCFVDDDCVYGVLLTSGGKTKAIKISIKRERLAYYSSISNPELWGQPDPIDPVRRTIPIDLPSILSEFTSLVKSSFESQEMQIGDHLCFSSHDVLLNLPLQYIDFLGKPLVSFFSVSQIPVAHALLQFLKQGVQMPKKYTHIEVPSIQDLNDKDGLKTLGDSGRWLANHFKNGMELSGEEADMEALSSAHLEKSVVHFSTHGRLPRDKSSGMVLAAYHKLPDLVLVSRGGAEEHVLNSEKVLNSDLDFAGSHLTFQTCVKTQVMPGAGRDHGMFEWAFLAKGAGSILSPGWPVPVKTAKLFINCFYTNWLVNGNSRAEAWRNAVFELQETDKYSHPFHWAAFSLTGDWR